MPNSAKDARSKVVTDTRILRSRSQPTGISGLADRICCRVKPASSAAPAMSSVSVHESVHGWRTARANPATARTRPAVTRAAPGTSILLPDASADSGTPARVRTAASTAIGTLTQNTACQPECSTSSPPASGPMASPRPETPVHIPMTRGSSRRRKTWASSDSDRGASSAAPAPCAVRDPISMAELAERPPAADPAANSSRPATNILRRPRRSPSLPPSRTSPAKATT